MKKDTVLAQIFKQSDGCTFAPDLNFYECCAEHDTYYKRNLGVSRFEADIQLMRCIFTKKHPVLAVVYFLAVRALGAAAYVEFYDV